MSDFETGLLIEALESETSEPVIVDGRGRKFRIPQTLTSTYENPRRMTWVYVMKSGPYVKVGIAAYPETRLESLRSANPFGVELVAKRRCPFSVARWVEASVHVALIHTHKAGEWFEAEPAETVRLVTKWVQRGVRRHKNWLLEEGY